MGASTFDERKKNAATILRLLTECCNKVPKDCLEPTLILPAATIRQYVREIENPVWTSRTDVEGYPQVISALEGRIEEIRDNLPTDWQDFSNWLRECTAYPRGTTPNVSTGQPLPPQPRPASQAVPLRSDSVFHAPVPEIKTPAFETGYEDTFETSHANIDPALLAIGAANEKYDMKIDTVTSTLAAPKWTPAIDLKAVPVSKVFSFYTPIGPAATNPFINPDGKSIFGNLDAGAKIPNKPFLFSSVVAPERSMVFLKSKPSLFKSTAGESISAKPIEKTWPESSSPSSSSLGSATKDVSPLQFDLSSPGSSLESTPSKTDPVVASTNDGTLEMILSLLQEERAARIEAEAKRVDAEMKQKQSHDEVLERIASLEKTNSSMKEAMTDKQKELDEREASISKREEAVKARQAKLEADISRQAAVEKTFIAKAEEMSRALSQMQAKLDRMEKEAEARLAKTTTPVTSAKKQEESVKSTILASTSDSSNEVVPEADQVARPKRKRSQIVKTLKKTFPPAKAVIVFDELKHGVLRMSKVGKAQLKDFEAQFDELLRLYERRASRRQQHTSMLIDLVNFEDTICRNDDGTYRLLNAIVKDAAIEFANERLTKYLFRDRKWLIFREVSEQHKNMQAIKTIAHLGMSLFDMNWALSSAEQPDEFDDGEISATPSEILEKYYKIFYEYDSALQRFLGAIPESSLMLEPVKAHHDRENMAMYDGWNKAVHKFGFKF